MIVARLGRAETCPIKEAFVPNRIWILIVVACVALAASIPISAQTPPPVSLAGTEFHDFIAKNGTHYDLRIALPTRGGLQEGVRYPVLYLLDGYAAFGLVTEAYRGFRLGEEVEPMLIVGVDRHYDSDSEWRRGRELDLTPSRDVDFEAAYAAAVGGKIATGGAPAFERVITEEIVPWVDSHYPASDVRALAGYSLGGLFAAYVLLTSPEKFSRYLIGSPSLWWHHGAIFELADRQLPELKAIAARVFLSANELEMEEPTPLPLVDMAADMRRFGYVLSRRKIPGLAVQTKLFEGETHLSGVSAAFSRGLRFLFAPAGVAP